MRLYGCTTETPMKCVEKRLYRNYTRMLRAIFLVVAPEKTAAVRFFTVHLTNHPRQRKDAGTAGELRAISCVTFSNGLTPTYPHTYVYMCIYI